MKKIVEITAFLVVWGLMITMGIRAGKQHGKCRECSLGQTTQTAQEPLVINTGR